MLKRVRGHFLSGLAVLSPLFLTLIFLQMLVRLADRAVVDPVFTLLPFEFDARVKVYLTKLAIAVVVVLFICLTGYVAKQILFRQFFGFVEGAIQGIPLFSSVYSSIKQIAHSFFGEKRGVFGRVVFVPYPVAGSYSIAFVMKEDRWQLHERIGRDLVSVFVPSPPNPATGFVLFVPKEQIVESGLTVEDAIRLVISLGSLTPSLPAPAKAPPAR